MEMEMKFSGKWMMSKSTGQNAGHDELKAKIKFFMIVNLIISHIVDNTNIGLHTRIINSNYNINNITDNIIIIMNYNKS